MKLFKLADKFQLKLATDYEFHGGHVFPNPDLVNTHSYGTDPYAPTVLLAYMYEHSEREFRMGQTIFTRDDETFWGYSSREAPSDSQLPDSSEEYMEWYKEWYKVLDALKGGPQSEEELPPETVREETTVDKEETELFSTAIGDYVWALGQDSKDPTAVMIYWVKNDPGGAYIYDGVNNTVNRLEADTVEIDADWIDERMRKLTSKKV